MPGLAGRASLEPRPVSRASFLLNPFAESVNPAGLRSISPTQVSYGACVPRCFPGSRKLQLLGAMWTLCVASSCFWGPNTVPTLSVGFPLSVSVSGLHTGSIHCLEHSLSTFSVCPPSPGSLPGFPGPAFYAGLGHQQCSLRVHFRDPQHFSVPLFVHDV